MIIFGYNIVLTVVHIFYRSSDSFMRFQRIPGMQECVLLLQEIKEGEKLWWNAKGSRLIAAEEAREREKRYEEEQRTCTLIFLERRGNQVA